MAGNLARDDEGWSDSRADTRWLSYDDLVDITGIKRDSVIRMVRRRKWPKRPGNQPNSVRIAVPVIAIDKMQAKRDARPVIAPAPPQNTVNFAEIALVIRKLEMALGTVRAERDQLREALAQASAAAGAADDTVAQTIQIIATERDQLKAALQRERSALNQVQQMNELDRIAGSAERGRLIDQHIRLNAQISALSAELARLHATPPRPVMPDAAVHAAPLMTRVTSIARWLRS